MPIPVLSTKVLLMWKMVHIYFQTLARVVRSRYTTAKQSAETIVASQRTTLCGTLPSPA